MNKSVNLSRRFGQDRKESVGIPPRRGKTERNPGLLPGWAPLNSKKLPVICLGVLVGLFSVFNLPMLVVLSLAACLLYACRKDAVTLDERRFIAYAIAWSIGIRIVISLSMFGYVIYQGVGSDAFGDARTYELVALYINELVTGAPAVTPWAGYNQGFLWLRKMWPEINLLQFGGLYSVPGISYWYSFLNILWGQSFIAYKILNTLIWVMGSYWLYLFFKTRFILEDKSAAQLKGKGLKLGLLAVLFLPSSLVFSSSGLKDSLLFFLIVAIIFSSHMLERFNHRYCAACALLVTPLLNKFINQTHFSSYAFFLTSFFFIILVAVVWKTKYWLFLGLLIICSGLLLSSLRENIYFCVAMFGLLITVINKINFKRFFIGSFLIFVFIYIISGGMAWNKLYNRFSLKVRYIISTSIAQSYNTAYGNTAYRIYPEKFYTHSAARDTITYREVFIAYLNGLRYVFLEPTPWSFNTLFAVLMFPETLFMWFFTPFIILGVIAIWRINSRIAFTTGFFLFIMTSLLVLGQGNMGTLVRTRCMVMPWYFMIGGLGLTAAYTRIFRADNKT